MPPHLSPEIAGCGACALLLLLPGIALVRSPWVFVPFLSVGFWTVSWFWLPVLGVGRERFLESTLLGSALLASLRLLRLPRLERPSLPTLLILVASLAWMAPFALWSAPKGESMASQTASASLLLWRDGIPRSGEPLLKGGLPKELGLAAFAADIASLSGLPAHRAALLASGVFAGLLQLGLYAFLREWTAPGAAAPAAILALGATPLASSDGQAFLPTLAFLTAAGALLFRRSGRASASAAGLLAAGSFLSAPSPVGPLVLGALGLVDGRLSRRWALAGGLLVLFALPLARAWNGIAVLPLPLEALGPAFLLGSTLGLPAQPVLALLAGAALCLPGRGTEALFLVLSGSLGGLTERLVGRLGRAAFLGAALLGAGLAVFWAERAPLTLDAKAWAAMEWIREHTGETEIVCTAAPEGPWIPAVGLRATANPGSPGCDWILERGFGGRIEVSRPREGVTDRDSKSQALTSHDGTPGSAQRKFE